MYESVSRLAPPNISVNKRGKTMVHVNIWLKM